MRAALVVVTLALSSPAVADERTTTMNVGGIGVIEDSEADLEFETYRGARLTLGWENAPLPYPDKRGYNVGGALVPELIAGAFVTDDRAQMLLGAGLRAELQIAQREGGLLRINAKSSIYVAARGMVVGEARDVMGEVVFGDYIYLGSPWRLGFELGATQRRVAEMDEHRTGMMFHFYLGYGRR